MMVTMAMMVKIDGNHGNSDVDHGEGGGRDNKTNDGVDDGMNDDDMSLSKKSQAALH